LGELATLRDALKVRLSSRQDETKVGEGPSASELAAQIKAVKAANTIESGPARSERKAVAAEESITARIRRRQEEVQTVETPAPEADEPIAKNEMSFQERILRQRQQNAEGEGQGPS
jgi:hypothetical protein